MMDDILVYWALKEHVDHLRKVKAPGTKDCPILVDSPTSSLMKLSNRASDILIIVVEQQSDMHIYLLVLVYRVSHFTGLLWFGGLPADSKPKGHHLSGYTG